MLVGDITFECLLMTIRCYVDYVKEVKR